MADREQRDVIAFLREEDRVLKAQLGRRRLRLEDDQRRQLAVMGQRLGRRLLREFAILVTPDTIRRRQREQARGRAHAFPQPAAFVGNSESKSSASRTP